MYPNVVLWPVMGPLQTLCRGFGQSKNHRFPFPHCFSRIGCLTSSMQAGHSTGDLEARREILSSCNSCFNSLCLLVDSFFWIASSSFTKKTSLSKLCSVSPALSTGLEELTSSSKSWTSTSTIQQTFPLNLTMRSKFAWPQSALLAVLWLVVVLSKISHVVLDFERDRTSHPPEIAAGKEDAYVAFFFWGFAAWIDFNFEDRFTDYICPK